jgi:UDP-N-acetylglucosamine 3-dehydrogenase
MAVERRPLRVGVAGVGRMGLRHVDAILRRGDVTLCAVADPSPEAIGRARDLARSAARDEPLANFADAARMLGATDLDCVIIATPPQVHAAHCVAALRRRIPVLVEKPLAVSLDDGRAVVAAAGDSGVLLTVGHIERFNPVVGALHEHVRNGVVGPPLAVQTWRHGPPPERARVEGVAFDLAVHDVDLLRYVLDDDPVEVETRPQAALDIGQRLDAQLTLASGIRASMSVGWDKAARKRGMAVRGELGTIEVDLIRQELRYTFENADSHTAAWTAQIFPGEPLVHEHDAFFEAIWSGSSAPASGHDALRALFVVHAMLESAALGKAVSVRSPVAA